MPLTHVQIWRGLDRLAQGGPVAMMCGTFGAIGGVRAATRFRMRMHDAVTERQIVHEYSTQVLPEIA